jgi:hypothetical protein
VLWPAAPRPAGLLSASVYLSTAGDTVLTYVQAGDGEAHRAFTEGLKGLAGAATVEYALHRAVVLEAGRRGVAPCAFVVAGFDVDGPDAQERLAESVVNALTEAPPEQHPGMISANFHLSADGSRVLNYAEWTSDGAHIAFLEGATRAATLSATRETPGVRPIGFKRYHFAGGLAV